MTKQELLKVTPKQLHDWYLEATAHLNPKDFNKKAQKPYGELTENQRFIDRYIADKINALLSLPSAEQEMMCEWASKTIQGEWRCMKPPNNSKIVMCPCVEISGKPSVEGATEEEIKHILWDNSGNTPNLTQAGVNQFAKALLGKIPTTKDI
jgi:hypothetical protein